MFYYTNIKYRRVSNSCGYFSCVCVSVHEVCEAIVCVNIPIENKAMEIIQASMRDGIPSVLV